MPLRVHSQPLRKLFSMIHSAIINKRHWLRGGDETPLKFPCSVVHGSRLSSQRKDCIIMTWLFPQRADECMYVCMCGWRREKKKKKKDWQVKSNYFEGLSIIHEKTVFQRPPERCTRVKDLSSLPILHRSSIRTTKIRPPRGKRQAAFSIRTDVNAPFHMHMSHSCARLLGLNGDDTPARHDHKC